MGRYEIHISRPAPAVAYQLEQPTEEALRYPPASQFCLAVPRRLADSLSDLRPGWQPDLCSDSQLGLQADLRSDLSPSGTRSLRPSITMMAFGFSFASASFIACGQSRVSFLAS